MNSLFTVYSVIFAILKVFSLHLFVSASSEKRQKSSTVVFPKLWHASSL